MLITVIQIPLISNVTFLLVHPKASSFFFFFCNTILFPAYNLTRMYFELSNCSVSDCTYWIYSCWHQTITSIYQDVFELQFCLSKYSQPNPFGVTPKWCNCILYFTVQDTSENNIRAECRTGPCRYPLEIS